MKKVADKSKSTTCQDRLFGQASGTRIRDTHQRQASGTRTSTTPRSMSSVLLSSSSCLMIVDKTVWLEERIRRRPVPPCSRITHTRRTRDAHRDSQTEQPTKTGSGQTSFLSAVRWKMRNEGPQQVRASVSTQSQQRFERLYTMRLALIGQNRSIFIGNLGLFWTYFDRRTTNAW